MKKIVCVMLVAVLLVALCACGNKFTVDSVSGEVATQTHYVVHYTDVKLEAAYKVIRYDYVSVQMDWSEYDHGMYRITTVESESGEEYSFEKYETIGEEQYFLKFTCKVEGIEKYPITVKDKGDVYEIIYYVQETTGRYFADKDSAKALLNKRSAIVDKENVVLHTDLD